MDTMRAVTAENGIDAFITKRDRQRSQDEGDRPAEVAWAESCREHNAERQLSVLFQRRDFSLAQIERHRRNFEVLVAHHEANLERVEAEIDRRLTA